MKNSALILWNLQDIINTLVAHHPEIKAVYLFGSRAYKTGSYRSDIDLLAFTDGVISTSDVNSWLHDEYPPVDLFTSYDEKVASSVINGSNVVFRNDGKNSNLIEQLDAILLWEKDNGFSEEYSNWEIQTLKDIDFKMSIIPSFPMDNNAETLNKALANLATSGIKPYFAGSTWQEIADSITKMIEIAMKKPLNFQRNAKSFSFDTIKINNEYDFQNMIHLILRPIYPDICPENLMITIDGAKKYADFGIADNKIVIEAKWINTSSKKAEVLKTLDGLKNFYSENSNVKSLIFLILYKSDVPIDEQMLNYKFSYEKSTPQVIVRFIKNVFE
ncbi:nucleotidyltransferase domain-containing protein [Ruminococcus flavefaciens]|uniref:Polymerase beta nucleotidyltransferase domain-containing protein n=1 Tax=Ruminococcus flavefaciens TaxID=1265 RepID=A0A1K1MYD3_RUMFL|nr:nucleotidyltransferase domain-containing protein [Ruminococcus flavefaciens]SFW28123.1 hypothetical protein SAMN02910280_1510 [Ruminococcus flavefaciens]